MRRSSPSRGNGQPAPRYERSRIDPYLVDEITFTLSEILAARSQVTEPTR